MKILAPLNVMAIFLSSLPLVSTTAKNDSSAKSLSALGALTCAYLIVEDDGEAETQAVLERCASNQLKQLSVHLHYQGEVEGEPVSVVLERPTYAYAQHDAAHNVAIFTLPALVHYSSLPLKLRDYLAKKERTTIEELKKQEELLGKDLTSNEVWWHHPITLNFTVELKLDNSHTPLTLGQVECVVVTTESNEDNYIEYLEPTLYFFDFLLANHTRGEFTDGKLVSYDELYELLEKYCSGNFNLKRSLILNIAQKAPPILRRLAPKLRKNLINTRKLLPVERINELDGKCLEYLLRLEGKNIKEKAQKNKMRLLGLTKEETYNLLENRVLKDFLERCITKVAKYQREELDYANKQKLFTNQEQNKQLQMFRQRCIDLSKNSVLATVHRQTTLPKPNFVLQKDHDYKQIWSMYLDLIREQRALDQSLICQQNLFQDVCELLLNTALCHLSTKTNLDAPFMLRALCRSNLLVGLEQRNGHRVKLGCAAGPFMIHNDQGPLFSLEVVSLGSEQTRQAQRKWYQLQERVFEQLLATAPCCLVLTKVQSFSDRNQAAQQVLIPIFTMHNLTKLSALNPVEQALYALLERMQTCAATIIPYLLVSTLEAAQQNTHFTNKLGGRGAMCAYLSPISLKPQQWMGSLAHIERTLFSIITEVLDGNR